jgi:Chlorophyll A-B binding protein
MKLSLTLIASTMGTAWAFAPLAVVSSSKSSSLCMSSAEPEMTVVEDVVVVPKVAPINGWVPNEALPCYGLPGAIGPFGYFDPLGFCKERELGGVKRFREAEIMHGRVAVSASTNEMTYGGQYNTTTDSHFNF